MMKSAAKSRVQALSRSAKRYASKFPGAKLARKAMQGTVGLPHGRRGMQVRSIEGKLVITR